MVFHAEGGGGDTLEPVAVDLSEQRGQNIYIRVVDPPSGRVSFDDFRFHDAKPELAPRYFEKSGQAGRTTDILALIDIARDGRFGMWDWDGQRRLAGEWFHMMRLPAVISDEYDLALTVEGTPAVGELWLILPVAGRPVHTTIDGWDRSISGFCVLDGKYPPENESMHKGRVLLDGQPNKLLCQVRRRSVKIECNGSTVIDWQGDPARLRLPLGDTSAGCDGVLVGAPWVHFALSQLNLTPLATQPAAQSPARRKKKP